MIKVIYSKDGELVGDYSAYNFVDGKIAEYINSHAEHLVVKIANEVPFNIFALRVVEDIIDINDIEFYWEDIKLNFDKYLGIELPESNSEFGVHLPVVNKIIKTGYQKRLADLNAAKNKDNDLTDAICYAANNMTGSDFCKWLTSENIPYKTYTVEFGTESEKWEINIKYRGKLIVCYYNQNDLLVRSNLDKIRE